MNSTLLISIFVFLPIALIAAGIFIQSRKKAKRIKNEMLRVYKEVILNDHLKIAEEEILYDKIFAADVLKKVFIYVHNHNEPVYDLIDLTGMTGCQVEKKGTTIITRSNGKPVTELHVNEVYLSFFSDASVLANLRIYSEIQDGQQEYLPLTKIANEWQQKLNEIISEGRSDRAIKAGAAI
jgi:hypothetical protein